MNEPAINSRSRDPACVPDGTIINNINNSMTKPKKSNSIFIHKISNLMETKYDVKRLLRTGTLLALLFAWMLTGSFVANSQIAPKATFNMDLTIVGSGTVTVSGYANPIVGPVANSTVGPFADGSLLEITATPASGWTFIGWTGLVQDGLDVTPNHIQVNGGPVVLTATFKRMLTLSAFNANNKTYDGTNTATVTTWGTLVGVAPGDDVTLNTGAYAATFSDELVGTGKTVTVTGLTLGGLDAGDYQLVSPITTTASITPATLTVAGAVAASRVYNGNTTATVDFTGASLVGVVAPDVVTLVSTAYTANFSDKNVGVGKTVTVAGLTLSGADAANYTLTQPSLTADITAKEIFFNAVQIANKVYDGTTTATIMTLGSATGLVGADVTNANYSGATATFADANVGNGKTVQITGVITLSNSNYFVTLPFNATGNIIAPVYAMFTPTYNVGRPNDPILGVALNTPLTIQFSANVYDENGATLNGQNVGEFVKLVDVTAGNILKPFTGSIVGNKVTIVPNTPLVYNNTYELYFEKVYTAGGSATGSLVTYTCDFGTSYDPSVVGALVADDAVEFTTIDLVTATLPVVTPYGPTPVCGNEISVTFVNPLTYVNLTPLTTVVDAAKHKFSLESSTDGITYSVIPVNQWTVTYSLVGSGSKFTFTYNNGSFEYNKYYRVRMNVGLDAAVGFLDAVTGITMLGDPLLSAHTQGLGWNWQATAQYPIIVDVAPWPISPVFPAVPVVSNAMFDANTVVSIGPAPGYALTKNINYTANVTLSHNFLAVEGEGYHFTNWKRSTNGGTSYTTLPTTAPLVSPQVGMNYAPQSFSVSGDIIKPASCTESIAYQANFAINTYTVTTSVVPAAAGTVTGGGSGKVHGSTVTLTATPAAGKKFVSWDFSALPASVQATVFQNVPDVNAIGYNGQPATITFSLVGPLVHASSWNVVANFAEFTPRLYAATDPQDSNSGIVNITIEFGSTPTIATGTEAPAFQGITYKWEEYVYNTSVKLEALGANCRYEFVKWQKWNPNIPPAGAWEDFSLVNPTVFFGVASNMRVKAVYKLIDDVHVSATANNAALATVIIFTDATRTTPLTINDIAGAEFSYGETVYITSYPEPDYYTWRWTNAAGAPVTMGGPVRFEDRSEWTYTVGCNDIDLKAVIDLKEYEVTVTSLVAQGHINGSNPAFNAATGNQGGLGFSFATVGSERIGEGYFQRNSTVNFVATPTAANYTFSHWETSGGVHVSSANPYTIPAIQGDIELEAIFQYNAPPTPTYALTVANNPVAGGSVNVPSGNYPTGNITATATAAAGYTFTGWSATGITLTLAQQTANPMSFAMPANAVTLTANYVPTEYTVNPVSRTYLRPHTSFTIVDWGGSVAKTPATGTFNAGETVTFTATPNPGFRFVNWMVGDILPGQILRGVEVSDQQTFTWTVPAVVGNPPMNVYAIFVEIAVPEYPIYSLTTATNPAGFGTVTGAGDFAHSVQVYVTEQVTEPGYEFAGWSANVNGAGDYVDMVMDQHVVANYTKINYMLHVESNNPAWGNVTPASAGFVVGDLPIAVSAFEAPANCNYSYEFAGWFTDPMLTTPLLDAGGNPVVDEDFNFIPYALPYPQTHLWIYAKFNQVVNTYDVTATVSPAAAGTASVDVAGPYTCGQTITFTTTANPGYEFQHWTKDGVLFIDQTTFNWNVDEDADFVAVYAAIEYDVTATATAGGSVAPAAQVKTIGQAVEVTATANTGYEFAGWTATGVTLADAMANPATFNQPANDVSLVATFVEIDYNVTATANAGGTVAPATQVMNYGDAVTVTATPAAGYVFNGWTATGVTLANAMANPASFSMPANNVTLVADFAKIPYTVTASVVPSNGGTTSALNANYYIGDAVSITATANAGFTFTGWSATGITLANPTAATQNFTMPAGNVALVANFSPVNNKLMGHVKYFNQFESGLPLSAGIQVALLNASDVVVGGPVAVGMDGYYEFTNIVPGTAYKVKVWESGATLANTWSWNNWGGVSAADALVISYMAAGNTTVNNFPWIAPVSAPNYTAFATEVADVDNSGSFTGNDPLIVMRRSIGLPGYSPFPLGGTPNFQVAGGEVATLGAKVYPQAPSVVFAPMGTYAAGTAGTSFYYVGAITGKAGNTVMNIYYAAGGDVNASYVPQGGAKSQPSLSYNGVIDANVGDVVNIPVAIDQNVVFSAMNMGLSFNNNLIEVLGVNGYELVNIDNAQGSVNVAWFDASSTKSSNEAIVIRARILSDISATDRIFELEGLNEISDAAANAIDGISFTTSAVSTKATGINETAELTASSYPNPFNMEATISYTMPEAGKVNVVIYNKLGQVVKTLVNEVQSAGVQTVRVNSNDLNGSGTYLYKVMVEGSAKSYTVNGTLILVK